ncbi:ribonuclease H-like domain-containing protein [Brevibacillus ruminantium]|uniref:Ribonuclease H-like domain-containing protein n=1 Tax=Brevibacillus ruminantium TaxID=2950604 RepID=A0ABY4WCS2_9BACL|nr:ribonuclease H-like domain-containing protein [Brevibacillus ruminantium]USG64965.1 ribonuclease H-like domain-containing protein [Brevibacillus ruminantium]
MSLKAKLNRFKGHLTREAPDHAASATGQAPFSRAESSSATETSPAPAPVRASSAPPSQHLSISSGGYSGDIPFLQKWEQLGAEPYVLEDEYVMVREVRYPISQRHGRYPFSGLHEAIEAWERAGLEHPLSTSGRTVEDLLFFDTETTGLHGGAGNTVFLLGHSRIEGEHVVVRQHFLAAPQAEAALYHSFLEDSRTATHLVTYNGKSFDWPQVTTRHTLLRDLVPRLPTFGHYDLLHGARRLWREDLESCRLSLIEREKLGVVREDDVPGYLAPIRYFDFLTDQDPDTVAGVLRHNEIDVLSLITLYIHLSSLLLSRERTKISDEERFKVGQWYESLGDLERANQFYQLVAASQGPLHEKAQIAMGRCFKKQKNWRQALQLWERVNESGVPLPEDVWIEMAKLYEHQVKDYDRALHCAKSGFESWKQKAALLRRRSKVEEAAYRKRIERLEQKGKQWTEEALDYGGGLV